MDDVDCDCDVGDCGSCDTDCDCTCCDISEDCCECCFRCFSSENNTLILCINYGHNHKYQNDGCVYCCCCCDIDDNPKQRTEETKMPNKVKNELKEQKLEPQRKASCCPCSQRPNYPQISAVSSPLEPPIAQKIEALDREMYAGQHKHAFPSRPS